MGSQELPDIKKMVTVTYSDKTTETIPLRFRSETLEILHSEFLSQHIEHDIHYSTFARLYPTDLIKLPKAEEWGTALCTKCLNPRFKVEALQSVGCYTSQRTAEKICFSMALKKKPNGTTYWDLDLDKEPLPDTIKFLRWEKVLPEGSKVKVDRKTSVNKDSAAFKYDFVRDLKTLKGHQERIRSQYREVRNEKESLSSCPTKAIFHLDWSTNLKIQQSRQSQAAFFFDKQVALHPIVIWQNGGTSSICTISDHTSHKAAATWVGLNICLKTIVSEGYTEIVIISDSPTSQYRNRFIVALLEHFVLSSSAILSVKWIYLEAGHGKGAADGVGAAVKLKMKNILARANNTDWSAAELKSSYEKDDQTVKLVMYDKQDVEEVKRSEAYQSASKVENIGSCHEIIVTKSKTIVKEQSGDSGKVLKVISRHLRGSDQDNPAPSNMSTPATDLTLIALSSSLLGTEVTPDARTPLNSELQPIDDGYTVFVQNLEQTSTPLLSQLLDPHDISDHYKVLDYVLVCWNGKMYPGQITALEAPQVKINVMSPDETGIWMWPDVPDENWYFVSEIRSKINDPEPIFDRRRVTGTFRIQELIELD